jgi:hypothetical protein
MNRMHDEPVSSQSSIAFLEPKATMIPVCSYCLPPSAGSLHLTHNNTGTTKHHAKSRRNVSSGMGMADGAGNCRICRRVPLLSLCGMQERCLPHHEEPVAQHNLRGNTRCHVHIALIAGVRPSVSFGASYENQQLEESPCCKRI